MLDPSSSTTKLPSNVRVGDIVASRYRLEEVVGRGGMGVVVAAQHLELDERVAVKFMSPEALSDPEAVARFDREIKAAVRLKGEYVARVYDAGKLPDGQRYMVLEFLDGEDLSVRIQRHGPLPPNEAIRFVLQVCSVVFEAHALGMVHRDLKPGNLRIVRRPDGSEIVKVLDFGVIKRIAATQSDAELQETQPGTIVGTPLYTSPEQLRGSTRVDARADIWSLGATLFELLTGKPPFSGRTYPQIIANVLESAPNSMRTLAPTLSEDLEQVVLRCLEKRPEDRFPTMFDLASALAETIELDSEERGLLDRMQRQHNLPSSVGLEPPARSEPRRERPTPEHAVIRDEIFRSTSSGRRARAASGEAGSKRRGLVVTAASATVTTVVVIAFGLPLLPRFGRHAVDERLPASAAFGDMRRDSTHGIMPSEVPGTLGDASHADTNSAHTTLSKPLGTAPNASASSSSATVTSAAAPNAKPPARRNVRPSSTASSATAPRPSEQAPLSSPDTSPESTARKKNPLLVRPR